MKKIIFGMLALLLTSSSFAGTQVGTVKTIMVRESDGLIYFILNGAAKTGSPACAGLGYWILKNETSLAAKQQYAMILSAQLTGKTVTVEGANACTRWPDGEDVRGISLND